MTAIELELLCFVARYSRGVNEERIWKFSETLPDEVQNEDMYHDALFALVRAGRLSWRLPSRVKDESTNSLDVPLIYQITTGRS